MAWNVSTESSTSDQATSHVRSRGSPSTARSEGGCCPRVGNSSVSFASEGSAGDTVAIRTQQELDAVNHPSAVSGRAGAKAAAHGAPMRLGSGEHLSLFCRMLLDTHDPYRPAIMDWPAIEKGARDRLVSLPIWDIAVQTEGRAR